MARLEDSYPQDTFKYIKNISHILSGGLSHMATPSSKGKGCASEACSPPTALSPWRTGVMGFCKTVGNLHHSGKAGIGT